MSSHKELIEVAAAQLKRWRCLPICTEMVTQNVSGEVPDYWAASVDRLKKVQQQLTLF